jgi:DNA repair ATPase RecN
LCKNIPNQDKHQNHQPPSDFHHRHFINKQQNYEKVNHSGKWIFGKSSLLHLKIGFYNGKKTHGDMFLKHVSTSLKHLSTSLKHVSTSLNHVSTSLKHVSTSLKHVSTSLKHESTSFKHVSTSLKQVSTSLNNVSTCFKKYGLVG